MSLTPGTRLGPYEITAPIGAGGMGEVYRATDSNLKRPVAIKVLPSTVAGNADRLARFQREAEVLAALNHPNIAAIYGLEKTAGLTALVMELVEGQELSTLIGGAKAPPYVPLPLAQSLPIARQIADALDAAHEQGIVHRDLKPANVKVRADGTVKVLDFGLAKVLDPRSQDPGPHPDTANSPTVTTPAMTEAGVILGTAAYMSPEQARGLTVDKRADIWAFGVVLYEMLTGRRLFDGATVSDVLAAVLCAEIDWTRLPVDTPPGVRALLRRCLDRDPKTRLRDIGEARIEIARIESGAPDPSMTSATAAAPAPSASSPARALPWAVAAVLGVIALWLWAPWRTGPVPPETRTEINTPATDDPASFALSPDGRQIVFVASGDGASRLWLRSLRTTSTQLLAGTEGASYPFWSPDGRSIGFFAGTSLKGLDLGAGVPQTLAPVTSGQGGTWNADGIILFAPTVSSPLMRVASTGGAAKAATTLGPQQSAHNAPYFLPDGGRFLFFAMGAPDASGIYLGALDGRTPARLTPGDGSGVYLPDGLGSRGASRDGGFWRAEASRDGGWLVWVRTGTLVAQRLDVEKAALTGEPLTLADGVATSSYFRSAVSVAVAGLAAYRTGTGRERQLTWFDRSGTARGTFGDPDATLAAPRVSADGRRVAVARTVQGNTDIWLLDGVRARRLTSDAAVDRFPVWSPDGARIAFTSNRTGQFGLYQMPTSGGAEERLMEASDQMKTPYSWSVDARVLLYSSLASQGNVDLWIAPMTGNRTPWAFLKTPFREAYGVFSPNGRWVAYQSNESGRPEVYVRPYVPPDAVGTAAAAGGQWPVSTAGGVFPAWRPDGKELYYLNPAGVMMAASITVTGTTVDTGTPVVLFPTRISGGGVDAQQGRQYDVAPDGRFLINTMLDGAAAPITLLQNWNPAVKK